MDLVANKDAALFCATFGMVAIAALRAKDVAADRKAILDYADIVFF